MSKQVCLNTQQKMLLDNFLGDKDNFPLFDYKTYEEIAEIAAEDLKFKISQSTVRGNRKDRILNGFDVWEAPIRKIKPGNAADVAGIKKKIVEHDEDIIRLYARVTEIENYMEAEKDYHAANEEFGRKQREGNGAGLVV